MRRYTVALTTRRDMDANALASFLFGDRTGWLRFLLDAAIPGGVGRW